MIIVAKDGSGAFSTIQAAIDALPADPREGDRKVFVRKGIYHERVIVNKEGACLVGEDAAETILTWSSFALELHPDGTERTTFRSWTLMVNAADVTVENLTIRNDAGDGREVGQAVAVYAAGDRGLWRGCRMIAHQDTLYCGPLRIPDVVADLGDRQGTAEQVPLVQDGHPSHSRQYFERCYIEGDVDFIFGSYRCWFEGCDLFMGERGGWYTAANTHASQPYGFVFHRCRLSGNCPEGQAYLGRPWRAGSATLFLRCDMDAHVAPEGFTDWDETRGVTDRYGEWETTGVRADLSPRNAHEKRLTPEEAGAITLPSVLGGEDGWQPAAPGPDYALMAEQLRAFAAEEGWFASLLSNASALIYDQLPNLNWAGFYLVRGEDLVLGPFQGKPACIRIPRGKGVCGAAWAEGRTLVVPDVHQFPGHIACDSASRAEIVLPLRQEDRIVGVLDIDSPVQDRFSPEDAAGLERLVDALQQSLQ